ncbi:FMN-dependent NADH-azoreductase [Nonomuraea coxensis DSM 45129]|uniref:FMN dependent NADH:quinone oxidoreductase n=1 Tax=Nonomuraea coxensis DSM 45129 TaxID=1122611 RepID=A0ABX8TRZ8_9ACTN|nr:NAD(P)H-dependent oxidoreductase [Nonomuraea coxensis]QYC38256.1 FMN-dependent NADH-azoreductase [Nonomuraea coxensis DSM 45129]
MLLHLDASARRNSFSRLLSAEYADAWRAAHPGAGYVYRDLAARPVPHIGEAWTELCDHILEHEITDPARYPEAARTPARRAAWAIVEPLLAEVVAADVVLIGTPMYNYSIPSSLKAWLDQITFPKMSLAGRSFVVTGARGGAYGPGSPREPYDHEERYLRDFLKGHFQVEDVTFVHAELVNARLDPALAHLRERHEESLAAALAQVRAQAREEAASEEAAS